MDGCFTVLSTNHDYLLELKIYNNLRKWDAWDLPNWVSSDEANKAFSWGQTKIKRTTLEAVAMNYQKGRRGEGIMGKE